MASKIIPALGEMESVVSENLQKSSWYMRNLVYTIFQELTFHCHIIYTITI